MGLDLKKTKISSPLTVNINRGGFCESRHIVDAVIVDSYGEIKETFGSIEKPVFARSAIKMIQAIPFVESGAIERFHLTEKNIALSCASHDGEKIHTDEVAAWIKTMGLKEDNFACGAHWPFHEETRNALIRKGESFCRLHNNCSGKHSGMLSTALMKNENPVGYEKYDHPVQVRLRKHLSELAGVNYDLAPWGIDGCGIPTYAIPLWATARSMAVLLPENRISEKHQDACQKIIKAITHEPFMISGTNGLCSNVVKVTGGRILVKVGAEGFYTAIIPNLGISMALKVQDGAGRASECAVLHLLQKFGGLTDDELDQLSPFYVRVIKNWADLAVGDISIQL